MIALMVTATYAYLLLGGTGVPSVLVNSVVVVIAFYFGSRAVTGPGVAPTAGLPSVPGAAPVPVHSRLVRAVLLLGFLGLALWFLRANPSLSGIPSDLLAVLEVLAGYLSGLTVSWFVHRRAHESSGRKRLAIIARDLIAAGALALTAYTCLALANGFASVFADRAVEALSLVVTFYFGSRVIGH